MAMPKNMLARCVVATGSTTAAILLYRIFYWQPHGKPDEDGRRWIAKDRATWMEETGLTAQQYRTAREILVRRLLVDVRQGRFGARTISFLSLTKRGNGLREGVLDAEEDAINCTDSGEVVGSNPHTQVGYISHTTLGQIHTPGCAENTPPYIKGDKETGDKELEVKKGGHYVPAEKDLHLDNTPGHGYKVESKEAEMATIKDLLAKGGKSGKPKKLTATNTAESMTSVWMTTMAEITGEFVPPLNLKSKGQLKLFSKVCPPGKDGDVLSHALTNWLLFAESVKGTSGLKTVPSVPKLDFLLKHAAEAVLFWLSETQPQVLAPKPKPAAPPKSAMAPAPAKVTEDDKPATLEEVLKIFGGGDSDAG